MRCFQILQSRGRLLAILLSSVAVLGGCTRPVYEIELTPDGAGIQRRLTVFNEGAKDEDSAKISPTQQKELERIRSLYDSKEELTEDEKHTFIGRFEGAMPADVGGAGNFVRFDSPLGATYYYSERFRGEDDLQLSIENRYAAIDNFIALLLQWSKSEISDAAVSERAQTFLDQELRHDLKNIALYCWTHAMLSGVDEKRTFERLTARLMQYLVERDYLTYAEMPSLLRAMNSENDALSFALLREIVLRKLKQGDDQTLTILANSKELAESLRRSIRESEIYQQEFARYRREHGLVEDAAQTEESFDPLALLSRYAFQALLPSMNLAPAEVRVSMRCGVPPFATNGTWNEEQQAVQWREEIDNVNAPAMVYAAWSQPDAAAQEKHLGSVALSGEPLAKFVLWYRGLKPDEKQQWDGFFSALTPGTELLETINAFQFENDENLADRVQSLLGAALQPQEQQP